MSVLIRFTPTSPTPTKLYDESIRRLEETGEFPPDGMELHCAFVVDGNVRVSEIWDSREQLDAFGERLMPLLEEMGIDPGQPEVLEVHNVIKR
jgi:hypothetical protein